VARDHETFDTLWDKRTLNSCFEKSQQPKEAEARKNRAVSLLNGDALPLNNVENLLMRARVDLGELKRGSRQGLPELMADLAELKSEIEQLEFFF
jgi:hypothetical protein